jgi:chromosome segregation ATPase
MDLAALFPPPLIRRLVDDLGAIAEAARRLPELEVQVLDRLDRIQEAVATVRTTAAPIQQLTAVREAVAPLSGQLDRLQATAGELDKLDELRAGIEPLDDDMRAVRHSVDELEPLLREVNARLDALRDDLAPVGELAQKVPGVG